MTLFSGSLFSRVLRSKGNKEGRKARFGLQLPQFEFAFFGLADGGRNFCDVVTSAEMKEKDMCGA
jgi:hypothetical protein